MLANVINILGSEMGAASHWPVYRQSAGEHTQYWGGEGLQGGRLVQFIEINFRENFINSFEILFAHVGFVSAYPWFFSIWPLVAGITNIAVHSTQCGGQAGAGEGWEPQIHPRVEGLGSIGVGARGVYLRTMENIKVKMDKNPNKLFQLHSWLMNWEWKVVTTAMGGNFFAVTVPPSASEAEWGGVSLPGQGDQGAFYQEDRFHTWLCF